MALQSNNCDQLLSFVAQTTNGIQEAFLKKRKGKHVNPRKFIQKRLNRGSKPVRPQNKPAKQAATKLDRHCVAPGVFTSTGPLCSRGQGQTSMPSAAPSPSPSFNCFASYGYPETTTIATSSSYSEVCTYSRPPSCQEEIDPELESLLSEFGLESPPSVSQCTGSPNSNAVSRCGSGVGFLPTSASFEAIFGTELLSSEQQYPFSPRSDYSDIDDSAYSSPLNSSPCPAYYQQHMSGIASCEWLPTCSSIAAQPAVQFTLPVHVPSHSEIIDMLATPTQ